MDNAKFEYRGPSHSQRRTLERTLAEHVRDRIVRGLDTADRPTPPLDPGYAQRKRRRGQPSIRNMKFTGRTLKALQPTGSGNRLEVGFVDQVAARRAAASDRRGRQLGVSNTDLNTVKTGLEKMKGTFVGTGG